MKEETTTTTTTNEANGQNKIATGSIHIYIIARGIHVYIRYADNATPAENYREKNIPRCIKFALANANSLRFTRII